MQVVVFFLPQQKADCLIVAAMLVPVEAILISARVSLLILGFVARLFV